MGLGMFDLQQAIRCARIVVSLYQPQAPPRRLLDHLAHLEDMSAHGPREDADKSGLGHELLVDVFEAAEILRCSPRHVRRIAADLDGQQVAGRWVFNRDNCIEYAEYRRAG